MDILLKIEEKNQQFELCKASSNEWQAKIEEITNSANAKIQEYNKQIAADNVEINRLQGEYRLLLEMGIEEGVLNPDGSEVVGVEITEQPMIEKLEVVKK